MNLINKKITHEVFGQGGIIDQDSSIITVDFDGEIKKFVYPDAFNKYITLKDKKMAKSLEKVIIKQEEKEAALAKKREKEQEQLALERQLREKMRNNKIHESSQIVFWLEQEELEDVFTKWNIFTGTVQSGKSEGQPNRAVRVGPNSASLLTVRNSDQSEEERRIVGIYMVKETFSGSESEDGIIPSHEEFKIKLTDEESEKMLFWNYYINKNYPDRMTWNSGRYRYYENVWTAQILKDIIALRTDEEQIKEAEKFLEYICQMNMIDIDNIPEAEGALKQ